MNNTNIEEEIINYMMVWASIFASSCYCYAVSRMVRQTPFRFLMFLPAIYLFFFLPLTINSINLLVPTFFSITWLATFKLLLLVFDTGPLSDPSLSLFHFVVICCWPLIFRRTVSPKSPVSKTKPKDSIHTGKSMLRSFAHFAKKGLTMIILVNLCFYKHKYHRLITLSLECTYLWLASEMTLEVATSIGQILLGDQFEVEPPFYEPYRSTSLKDFWGHRWNRAASITLRSTIFHPILHHTSPFLGRKWAAFVAFMVSFLVSTLMHEIVFYHVGGKRLGWGTALFFLVQGFCVTIESMFSRRVGGGWKVPQAIMGPLIFGFELGTFTWLILLELLECKADDRVLEEYVAMSVFVKESVLGVPK